jgi:CheY-like chemotaxis protein
MRTDPLVILLAEDDEGHAHLIRRNLKRAGVANEIKHVTDGQEALDFLYRRGAYAGRAGDPPLLLVLDINMPRVNGIEVLKAIKGDPGKVRLPVIMLTTTDDPREVDRCYQLGCSVYITKPVRNDEFVEAMNRLGLFLEIMQFPESRTTA